MRRKSNLILDVAIGVLFYNLIVVGKVACSDIEEINPCFIDAINEVEEEDKSIIDQTDSDDEAKDNSAILSGIIIAGKIVAASFIIYFTLFFTLRKVSEKIIFDPCSFLPSVAIDRFLGNNITNNTIIF